MFNLNKSIRKNIPPCKKVPKEVCEWGSKLRKNSHGAVRALYRDLLKEEVKYENSGDSVYFEGQSI